MTTEAQIKYILQELKEIKAILSQLGPVRVEPSIDQEIAAIMAQGEDLAKHFKDKGKGKK